MMPLKSLPQSADELSRHPSASGSRIAALDGLRGIASSAVLIHHLFGQPGKYPPGSRGAFISRALSMGWLGVDLFFVLSGFLIAGILLDTRERPDYFRRFYLRRVCRIFPLYYLLLTLYSLCVLFSNDTWYGFISPHPDLAWYWLFAQNFGFALAAAQHQPWFFMGGVWMAGSWSLAIEEQFYLALPAFIRAVRSCRTIAIAAVSLIAISLLVRLAIAGWKPEAQQINYVLSFSRMDALSAGVLLACAHRTKYWLLLRRLYPSVACAAGLGIVALFAKRIEFSPLAYTVYASFFAAILVSALEPRGIWANFLTGKTIVYLGTISYGTYLFHPILLRLSFLILKHGEPVISRPADVLPSLVALALTAILAPLSFAFFESPFQRFARRATSSAAVHASA